MKFFYHYNKPKSRQLGKTTWSVHIGDKCHFVQDFDCNVPVSTRSRKNQPKAICVGTAKSVKFKRTKDGRKAIIN